MNKVQKIIYDLLYDPKDNFRFDISDLDDYIENLSDVINDIVYKVNRGKVFIVSDNIYGINDKVYWNVKIKRS